ncbi:MAG TPA: hypothetical protein VGB43_02425, partial [Flavobacterium sp.]
KKYYAFLLIAFGSLLCIVFACSDSESDEESPYVPVSPVTVNLADVPYPKLSDYKFFEGPMKDQNPSLDVLPYEPASSLFTDYAHKKRFVWMPKNQKATYNEDDKVVELPVGSALIKTFYYDNVQNVTPVGSTRIIETRVMIRKANEWIFANYVWNEAQTEAYYDISGSFTNVSWTDENGITKTTDYRIPSEEQCIVCHKKKEVVNGEEITVHVPIGIKPQNLNFNYSYGSGSQNQLTKWIEYGYLENDFTLPSVQNSTIDWSDTSKPLELRVRSYLDVNCAHCHMTDRHCDYRPMRFAFTETLNNLQNMGVCVETSDMQDFPSAYSQIVTPGKTDRSMMYYRLDTSNEGYRMPLHGRTVIHEEAVSLIGQWIDSLEPCQ